MLHPPFPWLRVMSHQSSAGKKKTWYSTEGFVRSSNHQRPFRILCFAVAVVQSVKWITASTIFILIGLLISASATIVVGVGLSLISDSADGRGLIGQLLKRMVSHHWALTESSFLLHLLLSYIFKLPGGVMNKIVDLIRNIQRATMESFKGLWF